MGDPPKRRSGPTRIGVISDTHGLVRPQALAALAASERIVHAGDVGAPEVLAALEAIAPVAAIRGNNDVGAWARALPETRVVEAGGVRLYVLHALGDLDRDAAREGFAAVIAGHSHRPSIVRKDGVLFVNPGSAGPRRFRLPIAIARLTVGVDGLVDGEIVTLDV